jgi:tRNA threonylcarbamoyladenosine biosynthesis protein TsaB
LLGIDTCGPSGSVALGWLAGGSVEILEQIDLEGRNYSATLVSAVAELLSHAGVELKSIGVIVAVNGPGSFTGVRVGLSAVKGLAEVAQIPIIAVSRLEVLAWKAGADSAALDAHRHEVFLRLGTAAGKALELLAGVEELAANRPAGGQIALCEEEAAALLSDSWPAVQHVRTSPPTAADALKLCARRVAQADFVDLVLLDGHYLRRSDAEIFGEAAKAHSA